MAWRSLPCLHELVHSAITQRASAAHDASAAIRAAQTAARGSRQGRGTVLASRRGRGRDLQSRRGLGGSADRDLSPGHGSDGPRGASIVEDAGRSHPLIEGGRAVGVRTAGGDEVRGDALLLATGPSVAGQLGELGIEIGTSSPPAFVAFTTPVDTALTTTLNTPHVAIRRTVDGGLAMDSGWSERSIEVGDDGTLRIPDDVVPRLLDEARRVLSGHPELTLARIGSGYKPVPADGEPVYGRISEIPGLYVAFSHSGATQGLIAGELVADEIATGFVSPLLSAFRPDRFTSAATAPA
ncbi:NAD(P)/FAD-dependent oxidoreductase [Microbacterium dextranolyticum]|uniref:NAD(P)/FAD-dependent oxidoreductase n=1 Tax=Microbacterium dextranolyticum TaxID=36806 RepID=UPI00195B13AB|nr:FAD-binding oxidoreductase [Microbacterium dextranolyticum]